MRMLRLSTDDRFIVSLMFAQYNSQKLPLEDIIANVEIAEQIGLFDLGTFLGDNLPPDNDYELYQMDESSWTRLVKLFSTNTELLGGLAAGRRIARAWAGIMGVNVAHWETEAANEAARDGTVDTFAHKRAASAVARIMNLIPVEYRQILDEVLSGNPDFLVDILKIVARKISGDDEAANDPEPAPTPLHPISDNEKEAAPVAEPGLPKMGPLSDIHLYDVDVSIGEDQAKVDFSKNVVVADRTPPLHPGPERADAEPQKP